MKISQDADYLEPDDCKAAAASQEELRRENRLLKRRIVELEKLALRDTLTPLYNRRHFMDVLSRVTSRARRFGGDYAVVYLDVNHLKATNDKYGHVAGDKLLTAIAEILEQNVRHFDTVARMGGDEFAILLDNAKEVDVKRKLEKLRQQFAETKVSYSGAKLTPSLAIGYTMVDPKLQVELILSHADRSMYEDKRGAARRP